MDEVIDRFDKAGARYILIGGQAMRLKGMPRFSMDWDFAIPPRDQVNIDRINELLGEELDAPLVALGPRGENFLQTYQTIWGILQFYLGVPGLPKFEEAEQLAVIHHTETGRAVKCVSGPHLLACKRAANRPQDQPDIRFLEEKPRHGTLT